MHVHICMYIHIYMLCMYICIYVYVYTYVYTYLYTQHFQLNTNACGQVIYGLVNNTIIKTTSIHNGHNSSIHNSNSTNSTVAS